MFYMLMHALIACANNSWLLTDGVYEKIMFLNVFDLLRKNDQESIIYQYQTALMVLKREREREGKNQNNKQYDQIRVQQTLLAQAWTAAMKAEDPFAVKQVGYLSVALQTCCTITVYCILYYRLHMCQSMLTCIVHIDTI